MEKTTRNLKLAGVVLSLVGAIVMMFITGNSTKILAATENLAIGSTVTASTNFDRIGYLTDGNASNTGSYANGAPGVQWVQLDLGTSYDLNTIQLWHYYGDGRSYRDVVVQLSNDATFSSGVTTVFNNDTDGSAGLGTGTHSEYAETSSGKTIAFQATNARYVRIYSNGSSANTWNHYVEVGVYGETPAVPVPTTENLAIGSTVTASTTFDRIGYLTDGNAANTGNYTNGAPGVQWVQLDLGTSYDLNTIQLWHYYGDGRSYRDVVVQLSNDATFSSGVTTVFNNDTDGSAGLGTGTDREYAETSSGKTIAFGATNARYVRIYSNGSSANTWNHYVEVGVYGETPAVPVPTTENLAIGSTVTASTTFDRIGYLTDGNATSAGSYANGAPGVQWVQLDLGTSYDLNTVQLWHYYGDGRSYRDVVVQLSNDATFSSGVTTVFNNDANGNAGLGIGTDSEYAETSSGKTIAFGATNARYVRIYSNGSSANTWNHYVEVGVYGDTPAVPVPQYDVVPIDDFGAVGNGVVSDTQAYIKAVEAATAAGADAIALTAGKTYYFNVSSFTELPGFSIVGNGAKIKLSGYTIFNLYKVNHFILSDVTIESPYYENADSKVTNKGLFRSTNNTGMMVDIKNFNFICTAENSDSKVNRYPRVLELPKVVGGTIENLYFENVGNCLSFGEYSTGFTVRNVEGANIQLLVYVRPGSSSISFEDLNIENTLAQQDTWIGQNSVGTGMSGMDTILIESSDDMPTTDIILRDIRGTNCVERVIYCQASDVTAYDLYAQDTGGFKFVGTDPVSDLASNIEIFGATMIITDNSHDGNNGISQHYWVNDVIWHDILIENRRTNMGALGHVFNIEENVGSVTIDGFTVKNMHSTVPLIVFSGPSAGNTDSVTIRNVVFENLSTNWSGEVLWGFFQPENIDYADGAVGSLTIENVTGTTSPELVASVDFGRTVGDLSHKIAKINVSGVSLSEMQRIPAVETTANEDTSNIERLEIHSKLYSTLSSSVFEFKNFNLKYLPSNFKGTVSGDNVNIADTSGNKFMIELENASVGNKRLTNSVKNMSATLNSMPSGKTWNVPVAMTSGVYNITVKTSKGDLTLKSNNGVLTEVSNTNPAELSSVNVAGKFDVYMTKDAENNKYLYIRQGHASAIGYTITISRAN